MPLGRVPSDNSVSSDRFVSLCVVALRLKRALAEPLDLGEDLVSTLGPLERLRVLVVHVDEVVDGTLESGHAPMCSSLDLLVGQQSEPALYLVEPR